MLPRCLARNVVVRSGKSRRYISSSSTAIPEMPFEEARLSEFREKSFHLAKPLLLKRSSQDLRPNLLPASAKWFTQSDSSVSHVTFTPYMSQFAHRMFPYELISPQPLNGNTTEDPVTHFFNWLRSSADPIDALLSGILDATLQYTSKATSFFTFEAPLLLLMRALEFNKTHTTKLTQLYIAQAQLPDLPSELQADLFAPLFVREAGKGDIYNSSIWLGLEPTYTPLHRDPNPNLFCQLLGGKVIRMMPPSPGEWLYRRVQMQIRQSGNSRIRGAEMMEGPERAMLNTAVWGADPPQDLVEAEVEPGDALFIPTGWWHSVKSRSGDGGLNASVNWWFR